MPYKKSTQKKYGENPLQKKSGFKMKGSPMKRNFGIASPVKGLFSGLKLENLLDPAGIFGGGGFGIAGKATAEALHGKK